MKSSRLRLIILILSLVFTGAYLATNVFKHPEKSATQQLPLIKLYSLKLKPLSSENFDEKNNLTKTLGQNLFKEIKKQTETNPDFFSSLPNINAISQKTIDDSLKNNQFNLSQPVNESDLKISQDNSKEAKIQYITAIAEIGRNRMAGFNKNYQDVLSDVVEKNDLSSASRFADINKNMANDSLNLIVPSDLLNIHKTLITHFKNSEIVFRIISDYPNDPIKAYLAVQAIDQLEASLQGIQAPLNQIKL